MLRPDERSPVDRPAAPADVEGSAGAFDASIDLRQGLRVPRRYTRPGVHPFDEIEWELRDAVITNERGEVAFEQRNVEVPKFVVAAGDERGGAEVLPRGARNARAREQRTAADRPRGHAPPRAGAARPRLLRHRAGRRRASRPSSTHLLVHQMVSFNSPVWFNCGVEEHPQVSACFINSVQDTMQSILDLAKTEGMLFKFGSGTGSNLSPIRSSREILAGGGHRLGTRSRSCAATTRSPA